MGLVRLVVLTVMMAPDVVEALALTDPGEVVFVGPVDLMVAGQATTSVVALRVEEIPDAGPVDRILLEDPPGTANVQAAMVIGDRRPVRVRVDQALIWGVVRWDHQMMLNVKECETSSISFAKEISTEVVKNLSDGSEKFARTSRPVKDQDMVQDLVLMAQNAGAEMRIDVVLVQNPTT